MLMDFMRRNTRNFLIAITILLVPAFVLWGSFPSLGKKGSNTLLVVAGQKVQLQDFEQYYYHLRESARMNMGKNYSPELEKLLNLKQQALDGLIRDILFKKETERLHIVVSDQEVQDALKQNPAFYTDGKFDPAKWNAAIHDSRVNWPTYIEDERKSLQNQKLMNMIYSGARVTQNEVKEEYNRQNEKVKIRFALLDAADYLDKVKLTDEDLASYYEQHKNEYLEPVKVKLDYVELKKEPTPLDFSDVEAYAKSKLELAKENGDFADLAERYSDDETTKANGGDLGFFSRGNPRTKDIEKAAFALKPGEVSDLIRTDDGFHLIKVEEVKGSGDKKEVRARDIFFKVTPSDDTLLSLQERAGNISYAAQTSSLKAAAATLDVPVKNTPLFAVNSPVIPSIGPVREISEILPGLTQGSVSSVIETPNAFYVIQVTERQAERTPDLAEVKDKVESAAKNQKALDMAKAKAEELVADVNEKGKDLDAVDPKAKEALPFTRRGYPPELPRIEGLVESAFSLEQGKAAGPFVNSKAACVIQLLEKIEPDPAGYDSQKEGIRQRILGRRKQEVFKEYYENLKAKAGVKINQQLFQSA